MKRMMMLILATVCLLAMVPLSTAYAQNTGDNPGGRAAAEPTETSVATAEPTETPPDTTEPSGAADTVEPTETSTAAATFEEAPALLVRAGDYVSTTAFSADHYMVGLFSEITEGFNVGDWNLVDAQLTLSFSTTQLVSEYLSSITISINGVRFYSENVPVTDGLRRELTVKIPIEHMTEGYNVIAIEGYIRTYNGLPCVDDVTTANWMNVFRESFVEVSYTPAAACATIDDFYTCFTSIDALENNQSAVVVATGFDDDEIDAAFTVLAGISRGATKDYRNVDLLAADSLTNVADKRYVIYIAKPERLPAALQSAVSQSGSIEGSGACLLLIPGATNVLVVTGNDAAALDKAAAELSNATTMHQLKGTVKLIGEDEDVYVRKEGVMQYTPLTTTGTYLNGPFRQKYDYFINFDNNRQLAYGSQVELYFRYSENLDFDRSLISVYVNDVPVGSQKLSQAKADGDSLVLDIPTDIEVTGSFTLTVAFDLEIKDLWCTLRQSETPWAYVSSESMLKLNSVEVPYYLFENYPYPFISGGEFNHLVMVIPDSNTDIDLTLMGDFMLTLGQFLKYNTGELSVVRASDPGELNDKNVITVGTFANNPFIAGLNEHLFFRFYDNGAGIMSNEKLLIEASYGATLATAQLIDSPYSNVRNAILVLASANESDLKNVLDYFGDSAKLWELYGDGFVSDSDDIYLYRFKEDNAKEDGATEEFYERVDVMNLFYVSGAVLVILLVAVIFMVIRYRRKPQ